MNLEIERKFLLKAMPNIVADESIEICQYYLKNNDNEWERVRSWKSNKKDIIYTHNIKKFISSGINEEYENVISKDEFLKFVSKCFLPNTESRYILKNRSIYIDNNLKWEVDNFKDCQLIIAELEIPYKEYKITIPNFIQEKLLIDITELNQFTNINLSNEI
jgi:CYTH domain-containing protein